MSNCHLGHKLPWETLLSALVIHKHLPGYKDTINVVKIQNIKVVNHFYRVLQNTLNDFISTDSKKFSVLTLPYIHNIDNKIVDAFLFQSDWKGLCQFGLENLRDLLRYNTGGSACPIGLKWTAKRVYYLYILFNLLTLDYKTFAPYFVDLLSCPISCARGKHDGEFPSVFTLEMNKLYDSNNHLRKPDKELIYLLHTLASISFRYLCNYIRLCKVCNVEPYDFDADDLFTLQPTQPWTDSTKPLIPLNISQIKPRLKVIERIRLNKKINKI